jgi:hypothetical protein
MGKILEIAKEINFIFSIFCAMVIGEIMKLYDTRKLNFDNPGCINFPAKHGEEKSEIKNIFINCHLF